MLSSVVLPAPFGPIQAERLAAPQFEVDPAQHIQAREGERDLGGVERSVLGAAGRCAPGFVWAWAAKAGRIDRRRRIQGSSPASRPALSPFGIAVMVPSRIRPRPIEARSGDIAD